MVARGHFKSLLLEGFIDREYLMTALYPISLLRFAMLGKLFGLDGELQPRSGTETT